MISDEAWGPDGDLPLSEWRGLHNPERHERNGIAAWCSDEDITCSVEKPCYCCLAAEIEALQAQVQRVRLAMSAHKVEMYVGALRVYAVPTAKLQIALDTDE